MKDSGATARAGSFELDQQPLPPDSSPALHSRSNAEVISVGGESIASSEYDTISLFEETGKPQ